MPVNRDVIEAVRVFEMLVYHARLADGIEREEYIAKAFAVGAEVLTEVITELSNNSEYEYRCQRYSHSTVRNVRDIMLGTRDGLERFLSTENTLLEIAGWENKHIAEFAKYITENLDTLLQPPNLRKLINDLNTLRAEMLRLSREASQATRRAHILERLVPVMGGISLILIDAKAIAIIGEAYTVVSIGIGVNMASAEISELSRGLGRDWMSRFI